MAEGSSISRILPATRKTIPKGKYLERQRGRRVVVGEVIQNVKNEKQKMSALYLCYMMMIQEISSVSGIKPLVTESIIHFKEIYLSMYFSGQTNR